MRDATRSRPWRRTSRRLPRAARRTPRRPPGAPPHRRAAGRDDGSLGGRQDLSYRRREPPFLDLIDSALTTFRPGRWRSRRPASKQWPPVRRLWPHIAAAVQEPSHDHSSTQWAGFCPHPCWHRSRGPGVRRLRCRRFLQPLRAPHPPRGARGRPRPLARRDQPILPISGTTTSSGAAGLISAYPVPAYPGQPGPAPGSHHRRHEHQPGSRTGRLLKPGGRPACGPDRCPRRCQGP